VVVHPSPRVCMWSVAWVSWVPWCVCAGCAVCAVCDVCVRSVCSVCHAVWRCFGFKNTTCLLSPPPLPTLIDISAFSPSSVAAAGAPWRQRSSARRWSRSCTY
jgi:hypothetical protein